MPHGCCHAPTLQHILVDPFSTSICLYLNPALFACARAHATHSSLTHATHGTHALLRTHATLKQGTKEEVKATLCVFGEDSDKTPLEDALQLVSDFLGSVEGVMEDIR